MTTLVEKIVAIHVDLKTAGIAHAFGGALALAWCTKRARGTVDIDLNVFAAPEGVGAVLTALPTSVVVTDGNRRELERDGQSRLWWDKTPLDLFLNTTEFHDEVATRARIHTFADHRVPFLSCTDLAVFKVFFDRTKDWADLEEMWAVRSLDIDRVIGVLVRHLGPDDQRISRLLAMTAL